MWQGHWRRHPHGTSRMEFLLATLVVTMWNSEFFGVAKSDPNAPPQKPDPKKFHPTDVAWWLQGSVYDFKPEWKPEDEHKARADAMLAMIVARQAAMGIHMEPLKKDGN